jgi:hypothetical protein
MYYDFIIVSQLDQDVSSGTDCYDETLVKAHTGEVSNGGTNIDSYILVEFNNIDGGDHVITIVYFKDSSGGRYDDRGYVLIPKNQ